MRGPPSLSSHTPMHRSCVLVSPVGPSVPPASPAGMSKGASHIGKSTRVFAGYKGWHWGGIAGSKSEVADLLPIDASANAAGLGCPKAVRWPHLSQLLQQLQSSMLSYPELAGDLPEPGFSPSCGAACLSENGEQSQRKCPHPATLHRRARLPKAMQWKKKKKSRNFQK